MEETVEERRQRRRQVGLFRSAGLIFGALARVRLVNAAWFSRTLACVRVPGPLAATREGVRMLLV